jgi:serine/threonine-protein kinase
MTTRDKYRVIRKIDSGGMAEVFQGVAESIEGFKKKVAIKRVLPHLVENKKFLAMFLDEARLSLRMNHANVVHVFDIGQAGGTYFIVMEFVDGADLKAIIETQRRRKKDFPLEHAVFIATKICEGLAYAHTLRDSEGRPFGIVHRDVSPPNVIITRYGEIKIADFGLAKANNQLEKSEPGIIKGKFSYLAPEAAMGHEVDSRADIFAVGIILWEMLAGRRLFTGDSDYETVKLVQQANIPPLVDFNHKVPPGLERIILKSLARDLNQRYGDAIDLARDLNSFLFHHGQPVGQWDIARLVSEALHEKERQKPASANIIDQLIKEALFEFTSLGVDEQVSVGSGGRPTPEGSPVPLDLSGSGVRDWESEIQINNPYGPGSRSGGTDDKLLSSLQDIQVGNLSALEDFPSPMEAARAGSGRPHPAPSSSSAGPTRPDPGGAPAGRLPEQQTDEPAAPKNRSSALLIMVIVILLGAAGAAGAWYAQILPH